MENKLLSRLVRVSATGCWEWPGNRMISGYGLIRFRMEVFTTHRVACQLYIGDVDGRTVCHRCDNPPCCNPTHLFVGTQADNVRDMKSKGRNARGERSGQAKVADADVVRMRERYAAGEIVARIAESFGLTAKHASRLVVGKRRAYLPGGQKPRHHRLTPDEILRVQAMRAIGLSYQRIGRELGVCKKTAMNAMRRKANPTG